MFTNPTIAEFTQFFSRDFPFGSDTNHVMNSDIQRALAETAAFINPQLAPTQNNFTYQFLYLAAHNMVMNLRNSSQGINGQYSWLQSSRGVGSVSEGIAIPQRIMDNPELAMLTKTTYGTKYIQMVLPQLSGVMYTVCGVTKP